MTATPDDRDRAEAAQVEAQLWAARSEVQRMTILSRALAAARRDERERAVNTAVGILTNDADRAAGELILQIATAIRQPGKGES